MFRKCWTFYFAILLLFFAQTILGAPPRLIHFQGRLLDAAGEPLTATHSVCFSLYNAVDAAASIWSETQEVHLDSNGIYAVLLGGVDSLDLNFNEQYWLGLKVDSDAEMTPRLQMASSAYALNADRIDGLDSSELVTKINSGQNVVITPSAGSGEVTIDVPDAKGGDITGVFAGDGLTGGASVGDATVNIEVGTGLTVESDKVSFDTAWGDTRYLGTPQLPGAFKIYSGTLLQDGSKTLATIPNNKTFWMTGANLGYYRMAQSLTTIYQPPFDVCLKIGSDILLQFPIDERGYQKETMALSFPFPIPVSGKSIILYRYDPPCYDNHSKASVWGWLE